MTTATLTTPIRIGTSSYSAGTPISVAKLHAGTRDECWRAEFPNGEWGYLNTDEAATKEQA
jgi:hypothetical protein